MSGSRATDRKGASPVPVESRNSLLPGSSASGDERARRLAAEIDLVARLDALEARGEGRPAPRSRGTPAPRPGWARRPNRRAAAVFHSPPAARSSRTRPSGSGNTPARVMRNEKRCSFQWRTDTTVSTVRAAGEGELAGVGRGVGCCIGHDDGRVTRGARRFNPACAEDGPSPASRHFGSIEQFMRYYSAVSEAGQGASPHRQRSAASAPLRKGRIP